MEDAINGERNRQQAPAYGDPSGSCGKGVSFPFCGFVFPQWAKGLRSANKRTLEAMGRVAEKATGKGYGLLTRYQTIRFPWQSLSVGNSGLW